MPAHRPIRRTRRGFFRSQRSENLQWRLQRLNPPGKAARAAAPELEIIAVSTLDEAIDALVASGGDRPAAVAE